MGFGTTAAMDIGNGTTVAFTTAVFELRATNIDNSDMGRDSFDSSHFGTTGFETKIFSATARAGSLTISGAFDAALIDGMKTALTAVADTLTVVYPDSSQVTGTGAVTTYDYSIPNKEVMTCSFVWEWDGETGPNYT